MVILSNFKLSIVLSWIIRRSDDMDKENNKTGQKTNISLQMQLTYKSQQEVLREK